LVRRSVGMVSATLEVVPVVTTCTAALGEDW
jgi:hypothetical protein